MPSTNFFDNHGLSYVSDKQNRLKQFVRTVTQIYLKEQYLRQFLIGNFMESL